MKLDVFKDEKGNDLHFYENIEGELFITVHDGSNEFHYSGHITLDKQDAIALGKAILKIAKQLPEVE